MVHRRVVVVAAALVAAAIAFVVLVFVLAPLLFRLDFGGDSEQ